MKKIPMLLVYLRLLTGIFILFASIKGINHYIPIALTLISVGFISDIFDGIVARKLNVSTEPLRRLDSSVDMIFWVCIILATYIQNSQFFIQHLSKISILIAFEGITYLISFIKFKKEVATHAITSKIWAISLFLMFIQLVATQHAGLLFNIMFYIGIITRIEVIAILLLLKNWMNDVPSVYHAIQLGKGKTIVRHQLFNG